MPTRPRYVRPAARISLRTGCGTIALAIGFAVALPAFASTVAFRAELKGANMVPPTESSASGYVHLTYDTESRKLAWAGSHSGLSSKITHIDFHAPASPAEAAGAVHRIESLSGGSTTLSDAEAADVMGGYWNITIHTRGHEEGEIRGQVVRGE